MNNNEIGIYEKILIKLKSSIKNQNDMEEINEMVKLISVSLYYDKKVTAKEFSEAERIIKTIFDSDTSFVSLLVKKRLEEYINGFWEFKKDNEYIMRKILIDGNWLYAEYMAVIFKSDGVSKEEEQHYKTLIHMVESRKELLREIGLE